MPFSKETKARMFARCMRQCCLCRKQCGTNIEAAHIIDESAGGSNNEENGIPVCFDCHQEIGAYRDSHPKGNKFTPQELRERRDTIYVLAQSGQLHAVGESHINAAVVLGPNAISIIGPNAVSLGPNAISINTSAVRPREAIIAVLYASVREHRQKQVGPDKSPKGIADFEDECERFWTHLPDGIDKLAEPLLYQRTLAMIEAARASASKKGTGCKGINIHACDHFLDALSKLN